MDSKLPCRCCLLRPPEKDLFAAYSHLGQTEVYAEMIKNCFSIQLNSSQDEGDNGICETCVASLQDACQFKAQVEKCQIEMEMKLSHLQDETPKVKTENNDTDSIDDLHDEMDYEDEIKEEDEAVKEEPENECLDEDDQTLSELFGMKLEGITIKRKRSKEHITQGHLPTSPPPPMDSPALVACSPKHRDINLTQDVPNKKKLTITLNSDAPNKKTLTIKLNKKEGKEALTPLPIINIEKVKFSRSYARSDVLIHNMNQIINNSNATPFYTQDMSGIICIYCRQTIPNIQQLRNHIKSDHKDDTLKKGILKVDITDLTCNICKQNIDTIDSLKKHLTEKHKVKFNNAETCIFEFKLTENESYDCALCNATYERFKTLLQHMNIHYRNYVCETCDGGFINKQKLAKHKKTHELGSYPCRSCQKVFSTKVRLSFHEKYTHSNSARYITNCPHCKKTFTSYYWRNIHLKEDHNIAADYKCNSCDKTFNLKVTLTTHIKKVHLMERSQICNYCGQGFYNKECLKTHLITHEGERIHKCKVCNKAYARKRTLKEHMRIHANDRRFKCGVCGLGFVQKCSMKSHMVSNHGVTLAQYEKHNEVNIIGEAQYRDKRGRFEQKCVNVHDKIA